MELHIDSLEISSYLSDVKKNLYDCVSVPFIFRSTSITVILLLTYNNQSFKQNEHDCRLKKHKFESKRGYLLIHNDVCGNSS